MTNLNKYGNNSVAVPTLTKRQQAFIREYNRDNNATQAAIRAGYSAKTAGAAGSRLLKAVGIRGNPEADAANAEPLNRWKREVENEAYANVPMHHMTHGDKIKSLDLLGRHLGAYQDVGLGGAGGLQIHINLGVFDVREER